MNSDEITARKDLVVWKFDFSLSTFFEIPTEQVEPLLPEPLEPMEVAPGVALINITAFHFMEGCLEGLAAFEELICSAIVALAFAGGCVIDEDIGDAPDTAGSGFGVPGLGGLLFPE